jgi:hypothetical protein
MTRDQLARVFPDGKTVHVPADGRPMPGFELAYAEITTRGGRPGSVALATRGDATEPATDQPAKGGLRKLFASLFSSSSEEEEDAPAPTTRRRLPMATSLTAGPPAPGSLPAPAAAPIPRATAVAALAPTLPTERRWIWQTGPAGIVSSGVVVASVPLPRPRPAELEVTAALPEAIVGRSAPDEQRIALAYAPADGLGVTRPPVPTRAVLSAVVAAPLRRHRPQPDPLLGTEMVQFVPDLYHPNLHDARGLIETARAAVRITFDQEHGLAPTPTRFAGPAIAAVPVVAFDRGAIGSRFAKTN